MREVLRCWQLPTLIQVVVPYKNSLNYNHICVLCTSRNNLKGGGVYENGCCMLSMGPESSSDGTSSPCSHPLWGFPDGSSGEQFA